MLPSPLLMLPICNLENRKSILCFEELLLLLVLMAPLCAPLLQPYLYHFMWATQSKTNTILFRGADLVFVGQFQKLHLLLWY